MKAVICRAPGPPETLTFEDVPEPSPKPGEVVAAVSAVGLNFFDTLIIAGKYQTRPEYPFSPGGEFAGRLAGGRRVMGYSVYGAAAERIAIDPVKLVDVPDGVSDEAAASLAIAYGTSLHALEDRADLQRGETVCVLGASGGTGQAAIELAKLLGARVIACASTPEKLAFCREAGADETIDYSREDLKEALRRLTANRGVDVIYDAVGGAAAEPALRAMAWGGRYLVIGFASGIIPKFPLNLLLLKGCDARGVFWGAHVEREPDRHRAAMARLLALAAEGRIKPRIHKRYSLVETPRALADIAGRRVVGKAVVVI